MRNIKSIILILFAILTNSVFASSGDQSTIDPLTCTGAKLFNEQSRYDIDDYDFKYACHVSESSNVQLYSNYEMAWSICVLLAIVWIGMYIYEHFNKQRQLTAGEINPEEAKFSLMTFGSRIAISLFFLFPAQTTLQGKTYTYPVAVEVLESFALSAFEGSDDYSNESNEYYYDKAIYKDSIFYRQDLTKTLILDILKEMSKNESFDEVDIKTLSTENEIYTSFIYKKKEFIFKYQRNIDAKLSAEKLDVDFERNEEKQVIAEINSIIKQAFEIAKYVNINYRKGSDVLATFEETDNKTKAEIEPISSQKNWRTSQSAFELVSGHCQLLTKPERFNLTGIEYRSLNNYLTFASGCISNNVHNTSFTNQNFLTDESSIAEVEADAIVKATDKLCSESVYECADALTYSVLVSKKLTSIGVLNKIANPFKSELKATSISTSKGVNAMTYDVVWTDGNVSRIADSVSSEKISVESFVNSHIMSLLVNVNDTVYDMYDSSVAFIQNASDVEAIINGVSREFLRPALTFQSCLEQPNNKGIDENGYLFVNGIGTDCFSELSNATAMNYAVAKGAKGVAALKGKGTRDVVIKSQNGMMKYIPTSLQGIVKGVMLTTGLTTDSVDVIGMTNNTFGDPLVMTVGLSTLAQFDAGVFVLDMFASANLSFSIMAFLLDHVVGIAFFVALVYAITRILIILIVLPFILKQSTTSVDKTIRTMQWIMFSIASIYFLQYHYEIIEVIRDKVLLFSYSNFEVMPFSDVEFKFGSIVGYCFKMFGFLFVQFSLLAATMTLYLKAESKLADMIVYQKRSKDEGQHSEKGTLSKAKSGKIHSAPI